MKLTVPQCIDLIKQPRNLHYLRQARSQESRLRMHCEPVTERHLCSDALGVWLQWVKSFLPPNKYERFEQLLQFPLETTGITETIFDELTKLFDAPDKALQFKFTVPDFEQDFSQYLEEELNDENFWKEQGLEALKTKICSFVVIDLPRTQTTPRPQPYYYLVGTRHVWDALVKESDGSLEYLIYEQEDGSMVVLDELAYRTFWKPEGQDWVLKFPEAVHSIYSTQTGTEGQVVYGDLIDGLGYVPACAFWEHAIAHSARLNKRGPLTKVLGKFDWLLFWIISQKYFNLYGAWPIMVRYKEECDYRDKDGNTCNEGYINYSFPDGVGGITYAQKECPVCAKKGSIGPGSDWTVDAPRNKDEVDLMQNAVKVVEISNDKLEYGVSETERLEREIMIKTVGRMLSEATKEAINEQQVRSQYEAQRSIMNRIREQIESTRQFALQTVARLRYGRYFISASVFMGKEYFLNTPEDIAATYKTAKDSGLPRFEIARIRESYSRTALKSNEVEYQRANILAQLEPYVDCGVQELQTLGIKDIDPDGFILKLNFPNFIARFERENINVVEFGSAIAFDKKISIIKQKLLDYVKESIPKPQPTSGGTSGPAS